MQQHLSYTMQRHLSLLRYWKLSSFSFRPISFFSYHHITTVLQPENLKQKRLLSLEQIDLLGPFFDGVHNPILVAFCKGTTCQKVLTTEDHGHCSGVGTAAPNDFDGGNIVGCTFVESLDEVKAVFEEIFASKPAIEIRVWEYKMDDFPNLNSGGKAILSGQERLDSNVSQKFKQIFYEKNTELQTQSDVS